MDHVTYTTVVRRLFSVNIIDDRYINCQSLKILPRKRDSLAVFRKKSSVLAKELFVPQRELFASRKTCNSHACLPIHEDIAQNGTNSLQY